VDFINGVRQSCSVKALAYIGAKRDVDPYTDRAVIREELTCEAFVHTVIENDK